jgi:hypothetical protein
VSEPGHRCGRFAGAAGARLRVAVIDAALESGVADLGFVSLAARSGSDPAALAEEFGSPRLLVLAVYLANIEEFDRALGAAIDPADPWRDRVRATGYAVARYIGRRPRSTRFDVVVVFELGDLAQIPRDRYVRRFISLIDEGRRELAEPDSLGETVAEAVFGSIYQFLARTLSVGGPIAPPDSYVPQLMYIAVRPYLGEAVAREELTMPPPDRCGAVRGGHSRT